MIAVTIHGTFASHENDHGDRWWQIGSDFTKALISKEKVDKIVPLTWGGENSETSRRIGGAKLFHLLKEYEDSNLEYVLIGHSHGGMVIVECLNLAIKHGIDLNGLKKWITVGTPFIEYSAKSFFTSLGWFQTILASSLLIVTVLYFQWVYTIYGGDFSGHDVFNYFIIFLPLLITSLYYFFLIHQWRKKMWRLSTACKLVFAKKYFPKHCVYFHEKDEAIKLLSSVNHFQPKIFTPTSLLEGTFLAAAYTPLFLIVYFILFPNSGLMFFDFFSWYLEYTGQTVAGIDEAKNIFMSETTLQKIMQILGGLKMIFTDIYGRIYNFFELGDLSISFLGPILIILALYCFYFLVIGIINFFALISAFILGRATFVFLNRYISKFGISKSLGADVNHENGVVAHHFLPLDV